MQTETYPPITVLDPASPTPEAAIPVRRKIARLPKPLRDLINSMLEDSVPAREIIAKLQASSNPSLPYPISEENISDWRTTGYQRYLAQQERLALLQANREHATDLVASDDLTPPKPPSRSSPPASSAKSFTSKNSATPPQRPTPRLLLPQLHRPTPRSSPTTSRN